MSVAVVVGNPKPASRTRDAATRIATRLGGTAPEVVIDLVTLGGKLIGPGDPDVAEALHAVRGSQAVVFASPTYKASYTGLLKLFLDQFPSGGLAGIVALPLMLGGAWQHALAPEVFLKPVLVELGATCPVRGLYLLDSDYEAPEGLGEWIEEARRWL
ncbi:MAG: NADPH-dependent FMN reductase [Acidimicrobiales bacterium]